MLLNFKHMSMMAMLCLAPFTGAQAASVDFLNINTPDALVGAGFGVQTVNENTLNVDVSLFQVNASTTTPSPVDAMFDTISFNIVAHAGYFIDRIKFSEGLTASVVGEGLAIADGSLSVNGYVKGLGKHIYGAGDGGTVTLSTFLDQSQFGQVTSATVTITNSLVALSTGGVASIVKDFTSLEVETLSQVPIPAAVWLFGSVLVGFVAFSRRRLC